MKKMGPVSAATNLVEHRKRKRKIDGVQIGFFVICVVWSLIVFYPLFVMFVESFKWQGINNYLAIFRIGKIHRNYLNSLFVTSTTILGVVVCSAPAAYVFSKTKFRGKTVLYYFSLLALFMPGGALLLPLFRIVKALGLVNRLLSLTLTGTALGVSFGILILKSFMDGIPDSLIESAHIDGAGSFSIFSRIMMPLSRSALLVVMISRFMASWNEFLLPFVFLRRKPKMTVAVIPITFKGEYFLDTPKIYAACALIALPVIILYILLSRYFERGFIAGAVKE